MASTPATAFEPKSDKTADQKALDEIDHARNLIHQAYAESDPLPAGDALQRLKATLARARYFASDGIVDHRVRDVELAGAQSLNFQLAAVLVLVKEALDSHVFGGDDDLAGQLYEAAKLLSELPDVSHYIMAHSDRLDRRDRQVGLGKWLEWPARVCQYCGGGLSPGGLCDDDCDGSRARELEPDDMSGAPVLQPRGLSLPMDYCPHCACVHVVDYHPLEGETADEYRTRVAKLVENRAVDAQARI